MRKLTTAKINTCPICSKSVNRYKTLSSGIPGDQSTPQAREWWGPADQLTVLCREGAWVHFLFKGAYSRLCYLNHIALGEACPKCGGTVSKFFTVRSSKVGEPNDSTIWGVRGDRFILCSMGNYVHIKAGGEHRLILLAQGYAPVRIKF